MLARNDLGAAGLDRAERSTSLSLVDAAEQCIPVDEDEDVATQAHFSQGTDDDFIAAVKGLFQLRRKVAAERLGICETMLKRKCRRNGIARWPYRKFKFFRDRIHVVRASGMPVEDKQVLVDQLEFMMDILRQNPNLEVEELSSRFPHVTEAHRTLQPGSSSTQS
ncbi:Protein NLP3 [Porphyridium purpureum]|uniref:Protein NLP3 n=1 Tax=Porphyridium purpureum TaxID=35688 RepID=A0A5J4YSL0_PORPP|nr:Protein NLP3 [Porphyridium purpureum]|eukprot:POR2971..scf236_6